MNPTVRRVRRGDRRLSIGSAPKSRQTHAMPPSLISSQCVGLQWLCEKCGALLGIEQEPRLHVRHKELDLIVDGSDYIVTTSCRKCFALNDRRRRQAPPPPRATNA
jgi:hypothetical protein